MHILILFHKRFDRLYTHTFANVNIVEKRNTGGKRMNFTVTSGEECWGR